MDKKLKQLIRDYLKDNGITSYTADELIKEYENLQDWNYCKGDANMTTGNSYDEVLSWLRERFES